MGRGVYLIRKLRQYLALTQPAYIQERPALRSIRLCVIGSNVVHAYWRIAPQGDFRCNVAVGGASAWTTCRQTRLRPGPHAHRPDIGAPGMMSASIFAVWKGCLVLEANMKYGREGFREAGIDYIGLMEEMIANDEI